MPVTATGPDGRTYVPQGDRWVPVDEAPAQQPQPRPGVILGQRPPAPQPQPLAPGQAATLRDQGYVTPGGAVNLPPAPTPLSEADRMQAAEKAAKARQSQDASATEAAGALEALASARSLIGDPVRLGNDAVHTGWFNGETGPIGAMASGISGTRAYDLKQRLAQVKAVLSTGKMAEMRANSPTGGAVGNPTPAEWDMLANTVANLDVGQSDEQLRAQLDQVEQHLRRMTGQPDRPAPQAVAAPARRRSQVPLPVGEAVAGGGLGALGGMTRRDRANQVMRERSPPARPKGVPANARWDPATRTWEAR